MKRVLPAFVIVSGVELGYNVITVLKEFQMQSNWVGGAAHKAVVAFCAYPGVYYLAHTHLLLIIGCKSTAYQTQSDLYKM